MVPSLLTTIFFAMSVVCANRTARVMGSMEANFWRLALATCFLGAWAFTFGGGLSGSGLSFFLLSGFIGFGLGDLALFRALPLIGAQLSALLTHCLATPLAAGIEWLWMGTTLTLPQIVAAGVILGGVSVALTPSAQPAIPRSQFSLGICFGTLAALGQGLGAVLSRKAFEVAQANGESMDGITAGYQRIIAGVAVAAIPVLLTRGRALGNALRETREEDRRRAREKWRAAGPWLVLNALVGPALGIACYQWALKTTQAGIVLSIVATTPLVVIPLARIAEGEKPSVRSLVGSSIAVLGVVLLVACSRFN